MSDAGLIHVNSQVFMCKVPYFSLNDILDIIVNWKHPTCSRHLDHDFRGTGLYVYLQQALESFLSASD